MLKQIKNWQGEFDINDKHFTSFPDDLSDFKGDIHIKLYPTGQKSLESSNMKMQANRYSTNEVDAHENTGELKITVKAYMTRKASPEFDFMAKWNNDNPMPLRTMFGTVEKETPGMYYMKLHGMGVETIRCLRCGRELTNPISQYYGIGPECLGKLGFSRDVDIEDVQNIQKQLTNVVWKGYVIKSAITQKEEI